MRELSLQVRPILIVTLSPGEFGIAIGSSALVSGYHGLSIGLLSKATGVAAVGIWSGSTLFWSAECCYG